MANGRGWSGGLPNGLLEFLYTMGVDLDVYLPYSGSRHFSALEQNLAV
jgi:hypothetical protein